ncbi:MAG TPA: 50S ribosomal protein L11 methyltransferase [Acidimicrobiales bacterium]|nr:50S ribosomal protein L11 methyltransferase [Acidimicrobiales bacterium]
MEGSDAGAWWLRVECVPAEAEVAADRLWALGASAVAEETGRLTAGFTDRESALAAAAELETRWTVRTGGDDGAWRSAWRAYARPVGVGPFLIRTIGGGAEGAGRQTGPITLDIDPADSFGSGHHPTTRQCLAEVAQLAGPGRSVLDVGSGSGVLAVAAARLGAGEVVAIDLDHRASLATRANAAANGVDLLVLTAGPDALRAGFDLVVANLGGALAPIALAGPLTGLVAPGGALVVAGLLAPEPGTGPSPALDQPAQVQAALSGLETEERRQDEGWVVLRMRRR